MIDFQSEEYKKLLEEHQAICHIAGFQPFNDDLTDGFIFYLSPRIGEDGSILGLTLQKAVVTKENAIYAKDEVLTALKNDMEDTFPRHIIDTSELDPVKLVEIIVLNERRVANKVAQQTRRGAANTKFLDFFFYKGTSPTDVPFIVYKFDDKYGIWKHPNAAQYGFRLIQK